MAETLKNTRAISPSRNRSESARNGRKEEPMTETKTRTAPVPKQIRHEVKAILQHAAKNNGIKEAVILFVDDKGVLRGKGNSSDIVTQVVQQAVDTFNLIRSTAHRAFDQGWSTARQTQAK
jgi:hypothetical protein